MRLELTLQSFLLGSLILSIGRPVVFAIEPEQVFSAARCIMDDMAASVVGESFEFNGAVEFGAEQDVTLSINSFGQIRVRGPRDRACKFNHEFQQPNSEIWRSLGTPVAFGIAG